MQHRTEQEILLQMIQEAQETELIRTNEELIPKLLNGERTENQYVLDLSMHSHVLEQLEDGIFNVYTDVDLNTATGEALDRLGRLVNIARAPAQQPRVTLTVSSPAPLSNVITIPAGTKVLMREDSVEEGNYYTSAEVVFDANATSATVMAEHRDFGFHNFLPATAVVGLEGFPYLTVTNENNGTTGRNIEEDSPYRERIRQWSIKNVKGTRACLDDYLGGYDGLTSYKLIPCFDGVGTLKIVCDTLATLLEQIASDVDENCMVITDEPVVCVLPSETTVESLALECHRNASVQTTLTEAEVENILMAQTHVFVEGGENRLGQSVHGLSIGDDLYPAQLVSYLLDNVPEVDNIVCTPDDVVSVADENKLRISAVEVTFV